MAALTMEHIDVFADLLNKDSYIVYDYSQRFKIPVIYEDNHLIAAVKPAGVLSQADGSDKPDMLTILKNYLKIRYDKPGDVFLGLLHRLDCPVAGVMIFARTSKGASRISEQIRNRTVEKKYFAVAEGRFDQDTGRLTACLAKLAGNIVEENENGKESSLTYQVLQYNPILARTLLEVRLETGRAHQIRYLFSSVGHPLTGDAKYGQKDTKSGDIALFSASFTFRHPVRECEICLTAFPSDDVFREDFKEYFSSRAAAAGQTRMNGET
ncbi:MAG: RluA family pseudouridine synthase [Saccharofermentanales bacterium]